MEILILGGTGFVGLHIVRAMLNGGHSVTVFSRGTDVTLPPDVERLRGDRGAGPTYTLALDDRAWNTCIDVSG